MVARLRAQPGAEHIAVTIGDFTTTRVNGTFTLAYLVRNTITNLTTQDEQAQCFRKAAAHLAPGGREPRIRLAEESVMTSLDIAGQPWVTRS